MGRAGSDQEATAAVESPARLENHTCGARAERSRSYLVAEQPVRVFLAATVTAEMYRQGMNRLRVSPCGKDGDFPSVGLGSLTLCGQP